MDFLETNASKNNLELKTVYSDLFQNLKDQTFDYIIINPPYYPKSPKSIKEQAWFCGENFEYFEALFFQLPNYITSKNYCYMILSQDCELEKIKAIALKNEIAFDMVIQNIGLTEKNYIFRLQKL